MQKAFRFIDEEGTGKITLQNIKRVVQALGENMTDDEIQEMIEEADRDGDGEISEDEFMRIMRKTNLFWAVAVIWPPLIYAAKATNKLTLFTLYNLN